MLTPEEGTFSNVPSFFVLHRLREHVIGQNYGTLFHASVRRTRRWTRPIVENATLWELHFEVKYINDYIGSFV